MSTGNGTVCKTDAERILPEIGQFCSPELVQEIFTVDENQHVESLSWIDFAKRVAQKVDVRQFERIGTVRKYFDQFKQENGTLTHDGLRQMLSAMLPRHTASIEGECTEILQNLSLLRTEEQQEEPLLVVQWPQIISTKLVWNRLTTLLQQEDTNEEEVSPIALISQPIETPIIVNDEEFVRRLNALRKKEEEVGLREAALELRELDVMKRERTLKVALDTLKHKEDKIHRLNNDLLNKQQQQNEREEELSRMQSASSASAQQGGKSKFSAFSNALNFFKKKETTTVAPAPTPVARKTIGGEKKK